MNGRLIIGHESGASIVEFALVVPFFILALFAAVQVGLIVFVQNALDTAAREASRLGMTGQTTAGLTREQFIQNKVLSVIQIYSGGVMDPHKVKITVKAYPSLAGVNNPEPFTDTNNNGIYDKGEPFTDVNGNGVWDADQGISGSFGTAGQVVEYDISYGWDTIFPLFGTSSLITLHGITPVMNEEY
ncbi:MAG: pilus assembly protein [Candidatus Paracaedibacteraceae bacterium]|nr:pilus assembly protein [Candidatus Paracaedibacteraceae bacterium]